MKLRLALLLTALLCLCSQTVVMAASRPPAPAVPSGWPQRLDIPRIHVSAPIERLNFLNTANIRAPAKWEDVAWHSAGPRPGEGGHAAIFGHLDSTCCPAAFYHLNQLQAGDDITVVYRSRKTVRFRVIWHREYANTELPVDWLFTNKGQRGLVLLTCAGDFHQDGIGYDHKLVVYARVLLPDGKFG